MERYCLRHADRLLWPGGDVLATYQRFYGAGPLAPAGRDPGRVPRRARAGRRRRHARAEGPLRLLYLGRMERRKGVQNLVRALLSMEYEDWELSLLGGDTRHRPLGGLHARASRAAWPPARTGSRSTTPCRATSRAADASSTTPSSSRRAGSAGRTSAREAFLHDRPVLATPVGGLTALVRPG